MVGLVQLLLKSSAASSLIEDYAACLELRSEESQFIENSTDDPGVLILQVGHSGHKILISSASLIFAIYIVIFHSNLQLLIDNIGRPAPNITHLLLKFDLDSAIERTVLQPKFHYRSSCLKLF